MSYIVPSSLDSSFSSSTGTGSGSLNLTTGAGSNSSANLYNKTLVTEE